MKSPFRGILGSCPGQCIPSNQPTSYMSGPLSKCLDSLPSYHLNSHYNSFLHHRNWWVDAFLHRLNGGDHVLVWVVMHDLQRVHPMVVCHGVQPISLGGTQVDVMMVA